MYVEMQKYSGNAKILKYSRNAKGRKLPGKLLIHNQNTQEMLIGDKKFDMMEEYGWLDLDLRLCALFIDRAVFVLEKYTCLCLCHCPNCFYLCDRYMSLTLKCCHENNCIESDCICFFLTRVFVAFGSWTLVHVVPKKYKTYPPGPDFMSGANVPISTQSSGFGFVTGFT